MESLGGRLVQSPSWRVAVCVACRGWLPFAACVVFLACVGELAFLTRAYTIGNFLLLFLFVCTCLTIASPCDGHVVGGCAPLSVAVHMG